MRFSGNQQHARLSEIFQFPIPNPDSGGKLLAVGGPMIALVERGREMPSPIQLITENLAQRNLLSFRPPGLRVERGAFSGNNARDFPKSDFGARGQTSYRGRPYDRPCRGRPRNAFPNPAIHGKSGAAKTPLLPARRDSGSKEELSLATTREILKSRILDRGGKLLTVGGHMIALVERGREMPSPIQLFTENLAQRKLLSFPPGLGVERGAFSGNIAGDFPKSDLKSYFRKVSLS